MDWNYFALVFTSKAEADAILADYSQYDGWQSGTSYKVNLPLVTPLSSLLNAYVRPFEMNPERVYFSTEEGVI